MYGWFQLLNAQIKYDIRQVKFRSNIQLTKYIPYLAFLDELWIVFCML